MIGPSSSYTEGCLNEFNILTQPGSTDRTDLTKGEI